MAKLKEWDRREDETTPAFEAFAAYRDMGPGRKLDAVAAVLGKSATLMARWSAKHRWVSRAAAFDAEAGRRASMMALEDHATVRARQARDARIFMAKGAEAMEALRAADLTPLEAINAWRVGAQEERAALGIPTSVETKNTGRMEIVVKREDREIRSSDDNDDS